MTTSDESALAVPDPQTLATLPDPETETLALIERGRTAIAEAETLEEAQSILGQTKVLEAATRAVKLTKETITDASALRVRAERRVGEILTETPKDVGGRPPETGRDSRPVSQPPTLADQGLTKDESARAQKLARLPEEEFEGAIEEAKAEGIVTPATVLRKATDEKPPGRTRQSPARLFNNLLRNSHTAARDALDYVNDAAQEEPEFVTDWLASLDEISHHVRTLRARLRKEQNGSA